MDQLAAYVQQRLQRKHNLKSDYDISVLYKKNGEVEIKITSDEKVAPRYQRIYIESESNITNDLGTILPIPFKPDPNKPSPLLMDILEDDLNFESFIDNIKLFIGIEFPDYDKSSLKIQVKSLNKGDIVWIYLNKLNNAVPTNILRQTGRMSPRQGEIDPRTLF